MDLDEQLKCVEEFFNFTLTRIPDFNQINKIDRPLNTVKIRKDILIKYNKLKGILDEDLWQTFSNRSIYILQALENLVAADENYDDESSGDDESDDELVNDAASNEINKNGTNSSNDSDDDDNNDANDADDNNNIDKNNSDESDNMDIVADIELTSSDNLITDNAIDTTIKSILTDKIIKKNILKNNSSTKSSNSEKSSNSDKSSNSNVLSQFDEFSMEKIKFLDQKSIHKEKMNDREELKRKLQKKISQHKAKRIKFDEDKANKKREKKKKIKKNKNISLETDINLKMSKSSHKQSENTEIIPTTKFNPDKAIIFSKIEFPGKPKMRAKFKGLQRGKNYEQLLNMVEKEKNKIKQLESVDENKAKNFKNKILWRKVIAKAEGVKIRDDERKLIRSLNKKKYKKVVSKQKWNDRKKMVGKKKKVPTATLR